MTELPDGHWEVAERFVVPFYGQMLHGNCLRMDRSTVSDWVGRLRDAANELDTVSAQMLLETREWRGRMAVSWMIGLNGWHDLTEGIASRLLSSELVYAGQGHAVGLALLGSDVAASRLCAYLDHWLPKVECRYDQHWALAALVEIDKHRGTSLAAEYMRPDGPWEQWIGDRSFGLAPVSSIVDLLGEGDDARTSRPQA
ncbi:MAG: DUF6000 family protein [Acidobacteriota bacterium]